MACAVKHRRLMMDYQERCERADSHSVIDIPDTHGKETRIRIVFGDWQQVKHSLGQPAAWDTYSVVLW